MFPSARLGLLALLRSIRYIGLAFKSVILRCLFFQSHVPHNLRRILSLCSRTGPKDVPEKAGGQAKPSFPRASGVCEGYSAIHASRDFNRASEPHLPLGPGNAEVLQLSPMVGQSQSVPHSPASSHGSIRPAHRPFSMDRTHSITDSIHSDTQLPIRRSNNPFTLMHSRVTSTEFTEAPRPDRSPSPSKSPFPNIPFPLSTTLESSGGTQIPDSDVSQTPRGTSMRFRPSYEIGVSVPSSDPVHSPLSPEPFSSESPPPWSSPSRSQEFVESIPLPIPVVGSTPALPNGRVLQLMHSEQVSRYTNKVTVSPEIIELALPPMTTNLHRHSHVESHEGWVPAIHPGGALYFCHPERRMFTDVYMHDPILSEEIRAFAEYLSTIWHWSGRPFPMNSCDLVLDILPTENGRIIWGYYYVHHENRTLFWLDEYKCGVDMLREVRGVREASHLSYRLESLYWLHWSLYPFPSREFRFPEDAPDELLGVLLSSGIDSLTSKVSTSPYTVAEIESMRDFIKEAKSLGTENSHVITSVARLLSFYAYWRFLHFHGQIASHDDRYKSIYSLKADRPKRTILVRILSPILFFFPKVHLLELEKVWRGKTEKVIVEALWKAFMQKLVSQWTVFVLYSTVMLAANVAFLAIPGVIVTPPDTRIRPSPAQITSSISLVFSIGSIITGLLLIQHNNMMTTKNPKNAWRYLHGMKWPVVGLEPLAIVFSLTYALLMWSVWGFFVALLLFTFQDTSGKILILVGIIVGIITTLIVWCIKHTWDPEGREEEPIEWPYEPGPQVRTSLRQGSPELSGGVV